MLPSTLGLMEGMDNLVGWSDTSESERSRCITCHKARMCE